MSLQAEDNAPQIAANTRQADARQADVRQADARRVDSAQGRPTSLRFCRANNYRQ